MQTIIMILVDFLRVIVLSRATLQLENIALRQQVAVLKRERPRPWLRPLDRVFWIFLSRLWPRWKDALVFVKPQTVIGRLSLLKTLSAAEILGFPILVSRCELHVRVHRTAARTLDLSAGWN